MNLHEYQAKRLFAEQGVPIPPGEVASSPADVRDIARELGGKVVVKAQVLTYSKRNCCSTLPGSNRLASKELHS